MQHNGNQQNDIKIIDMQYDGIQQNDTKLSAMQHDGIQQNDAKTKSISYTRITFCRIIFTSATFRTMAYSSIMLRQRI